MAEKKLFQLISTARCAHRNRLTAEQQQVYDKMVEAAAEHKSSATVRGSIKGKMKDVFSAVLLDQPFLFDMERTNLTLSRSIVSTTISWENRLSDEEAEKYRIRVNEELRRILAMLPDGGNALEMERAIHDLIPALGIRRLPSGEGKWWTHTIVGPLLYKETVCEGLALLFYVLCLLKGVPCQVINGQGNGRVEGPGPHAWNMVRLGSQYAHVDAYWDMCLADGGEKRYDYFNLQDAQIRLDHTWDTAKFPVCVAERYSWFVRNGAEAGSMDELRQLLDKRFREGDATMRVRFRRPVEREALAAVMRDACNSIFHRGIQWDYNDRQRVVTVTVTG